MKTRNYWWQSLGMTQKQVSDKLSDIIKQRRPMPTRFSSEELDLLNEFWVNHPGTDAQCRDAHLTGEPPKFKIWRGHSSHHPTSKAIYSRTPNTDWAVLGKSIGLRGHRTPTARLIMALRHEVAYQSIDALSAAGHCSGSGYEADHAGRSFAEIAETFIENYSDHHETGKEFPIKKVSSGSYELDDQHLAGAWRDYHEQEVEWQILSAKEHRKLTSARKKDLNHS